MHPYPQTFLDSLSFYDMEQQPDLHRLASGLLVAGEEASLLQNAPTNQALANILQGLRGDILQMGRENDTRTNALRTELRTEMTTQFHALQTRSDAR